MTCMDSASKGMGILAVFIFIVSPLLAWGSIIVSDDTAVYASLSRMIWYSGSSSRIFIAMLALFLPMLRAFFLAHDISGISKTQTLALRICMIVSCAVLYVGAMWVMPGNGSTTTTENVWHGVLSFGGIMMIFLTYCLYTALVFRKDKDGAGLLAGFLAFALITGAFAVLNIFDDRSYVIASAASELYFLTMMSLIGFLTYYLAYRKAQSNS